MKTVKLLIAISVIGMFSTTNCHAGFFDKIEKSISNPVKILNVVVDNKNTETLPKKSQINRKNVKEDKPSKKVYTTDDGKKWREEQKKNREEAVANHRKKMEQQIANERENRLTNDVEFFYFKKVNKNVAVIYSKKDWDILNSTYIKNNLVYLFATSFYYHTNPNTLILEHAAVKKYKHSDTILKNELMYRSFNKNEVEKLLSHFKKAVEWEKVAKENNINVQKKIGDVNEYTVTFRSSNDGRNSKVLFHMNKSINFLNDGMVTNFTETLTMTKTRDIIFKIENITKIKQNKQNKENSHKVKVDKLFQ